MQPSHRTTLLSLCLLFTSAVSTFASPIVFQASGSFTSGGTLSGTVTIDTATGDVLSADLSATVNQTFTFSNNIGGIPNYANSGLFVIVANATPGGYPIALIGVNENSLVGYAGGPISGASDFIFQDASVFGLLSGALALDSVNGPLSTFKASGTVNGGGPVGGTVTINTTTGELSAVSVTAVIPRTYALSAGVGGVPNYANSGLFVIVVNEAAGGYPIALLGLPVGNLVGYNGGALSGASDLIFQDGTVFGLVNGTLTAPVPEPATWTCFALAGSLAAVAKWRKRA